MSYWLVQELINNLANELCDNRDTMDCRFVIALTLCAGVLIVVVLTWIILSICGVDLH